MITAGVILIVIGVTGIFGTVQIIRMSFKVRKWPTVPGKISERKVVENNIPSPDPGTYYEPYVKYSYAVGGKNYTGNKIYAASYSYIERDAKRALVRLPADVTVYYNPENPQQAYLSPAPLLLPIAGLIISISAFIFGLSLLM